MKPVNTLAPCVLLVGFVGAAHADPDSFPFADDAEVETLTDGYRFTEGPAVAPDGSVYFSNIPNNAIHRYDPATGETELFTDDSGGANGLFFSRFGLFACAGNDRAVHWYPRGNAREPLEQTRKVVAEQYQDLRLNSPNDLVVTRGTESGIPQDIYFTDPRYGNRDNMELDTEAVYLVSVTSARGDGLPWDFAMIRVADDFVRPNGIGLSPDETTLYVNDNGAKQVIAFDRDRHDPANMKNRRVLHDLADLGGPDGMCVDSHGRLYVAIYDKGIAVLSPAGRRLGFVPTGPQTTNCALDAEERFLYVTSERALKRVALVEGE